MMAYNGYTEAKKKANKKYMTEKVDSITFYPTKGKKEELKSVSKEHGLSVNAAMNKALDHLLEHPELLDQ